MPLPIEQRELRSADVDAVREQLGREPTTPFLVVARCAGGHPLVIRNAPLDANGEPFPTTYWLTCPTAVKAVSRIESEGWIARLNDRIHGDEAVRRCRRSRAPACAADRATRPAGGSGLGGRGGTRMGVKCLHAHYAYHLAGGEDPVGAWVEGPGRTRAPRRTGRSRRRGRPGHELDPAAGLGTGRHRARARHGHHAAGAGCRPDGSARSRCTPAHDRRARHVLSARASIGRRSHPGRRHQRRSRCLQPRCVRSRGPPSCGRAARGDHR